MPKRYSEEFKKQVTTMCVLGTPLVAISEKYNISLNILYRWRKEYQRVGEQTTTKDYQTLYRQYERQNHILQIIWLSNIINDVPRRKRLEILARLHEQFEQYSIHELCEALNISRGTFYHDTIEDYLLDAQKRCQQIDEPVLYKILLPVSECVEALIDLQFMNINFSALYGDADGYAQDAVLR